MEEIVMNNRRRSRFYIGALLFILMFTTVILTSIPVQARTIWLNQGRFSFRVNDNFQGTNEFRGTRKLWVSIGNFPNGSDRLHSFQFLRKSALIGHFTDGGGNEFGPPGSGKSVWFSGRNDMGSWNEELPFGVWEITRNPLPEVYVDGQDANVYNENPDVIWKVDENIKADKMAEVFGKTSPGFYTRYRAYQMVNQYYGDFVILEITYKLSFDDAKTPEMKPGDGWDINQTVEDVYFIQEVGPFAPPQAISFFGTIWYTGWEKAHSYKWQVVPSNVPGAARDSLFMFYGFDRERPQKKEFLSAGGPFGRDWDDFGIPRNVPAADGNLLNVTYKGASLLHVDKSATDKSDWSAQPHAFWIDRSKHFRWIGNQGAWRYYGGDAAPGSVNPSTNEPDYDTIGRGPISMRFSMGPFDLTYEDSVTYVYALGAGAISREEARKIGAAWAAWYSKGDVAEAYYNGELVTDEVKDRYIRQGEDSLKVTMQRAYELWSNNMECPHPYPAPDLYVSSAKRGNVLKFTDVGRKYPNPNGGGDDVVAYRIYHKYGNVLDDAQEEAGRNVYWKMVAEIPVGELERDPADPDYFVYKDTDVIIGEDYYYSVTAVSGTRCGIDGSGPRLESSKWLNRTQIGAVPFIPGAASLDSIYVVPNPYYIAGKGMNLLSEGGNRLMIFGLPDQCSIKIYNITGDLIREVEHSGGSAIDIWNQVTENNQYIASGIYIAVITDAKKEIKDSVGNVTGTESLEGKKFVKFSIIR